MGLPDGCRWAFATESPRGLKAIKGACIRDTLARYGPEEIALAIMAQVVATRRNPAST